MLHARWLVSARVIGGRAPDVTDSTMTASTSKHFIKINDRGDELRRQKCALTHTGPGEGKRQKGSYSALLCVCVTLRMRMLGRRWGRLGAVTTVTINSVSMARAERRLACCRDSSPKNQMCKCNASLAGRHCRRLGRSRIKLDGLQKGRLGDYYS